MRPRKNIGIGSHLLGFPTWRPCSPSGKPVSPTSQELEVSSFSQLALRQTYQANGTEKTPQSCLDIYKVGNMSSYYYLVVLLFVPEVRGEAGTSLNFPHLSLSIPTKSLSMQSCHLSHSLSLLLLPVTRSTSALFVDHSSLLYMLLYSLKFFFWIFRQTEKNTFQQGENRDGGQKHEALTLFCAIYRVTCTVYHVQCTMYSVPNPIMENTDD